MFGSRMGVLFDPLVATEASLALVFDAIFTPERAQRLATQQSGSTAAAAAAAASSFSSSAALLLLPTFMEVMNNVTYTVFPLHGPSSNRTLSPTLHHSYMLESMTRQTVLVNTYLKLLNHPSASFLVMTQVKAHLATLNRYRTITPRVVPPYRVVRHNRVAKDLYDMHLHLDTFIFF